MIPHFNHVSFCPVSLDIPLSLWNERYEHNLPVFNSHGRVWTMLNEDEHIICLPVCLPACLLSVLCVLRYAMETRKMKYKVKKTVCHHRSDPQLFQHACDAPPASRTCCEILKRQRVKESKGQRTKENAVVVCRVPSFPLLRCAVQKMPPSLTLTHSLTHASIALPCLQTQQNKKE